MAANDMSYLTGQSKSLDDITLDDCLRYPIWEWALDEAAIEGQDETWQRPITSTSDVSEDIFEPIITFQVENSDAYGAGSYDKKRDLLYGNSLWVDGAWKTFDSLEGFTSPLILIAVPSIQGVSNVKFRCDDLTRDEAYRVM